MLRLLLDTGRSARVLPLINLRDFLHPAASPSARSVWTDPPSKDEKTTSFYDVTVEEYAKEPITKLSLHYMLQAGRDAWFDESKVLESARFVWEELPRRLARRLLDLQLLPYIVVTNPHIDTVYKAYLHAFNVIRASRPPENMKENEEFALLLRRLVDEHAPMLDALANGLRDVRRKPLVGEHLHLDPFLEAMLRSRISRRVLAEHHINLANGRPGYIGIICTDLSLADAIDFAAGRCKQVCQETFGAAPDVLVSGDINLRVPYIPAHLDYMLYELLKNGARAVTERHLKRQATGGGAIGARMPPLHVRICGGEDDVTIRISDQGGGIPPQFMKKVWEFGWTDLDPGGPPGSNEDLRREGLGLDSGPASFWAGASEAAAVPGGGRYRMAGLGFGLPLSKLYATYFGGDLRLVSMPGYGVDAFLQLKGLVAEGRDWRENSEDEPGSIDEATMLGADAMVARAGKGTV